MYIAKKTSIIVIILMFLFSKQEINAVDTIVRVAFEYGLPPYQFIENGQSLGVHIDILNNIAQKNNFTIEYVPMKSEIECYNALEVNSVDLVLGVVKNEKFRYQSTDSISQSSIIMISNKDKANTIRNNKNKLIKTVFENDTISYSYIQKIKNMRYRIVSNQSRAFNVLTSGDADVLIGVKSSIIYQLQKANLEDEYTIINNYMVPIEYTILTKKGDSDFLRKLNSDLQQLRISGEYVKIHDKWVNEENYLMKEIINYVIALIIIFILIFLFITVVNYRLNNLLKKQVREKTKELLQINEDLQKQIIETRNNNELKNCIVEHSPSCIIVFDTDFKINLFNKSACKLTNLSSLNIGQSILEIPFIYDILNDKLNKIFNENLTIINEEITISDEYVENKSYRYDIYQLYNMDNSIRGAIVLVDNVTEELKIKEEIFEKQKNIALNKIIAEIAHEIRNPLTSIKTIVQMIPFKKEDQKFQFQLADIVPKEVDRVNNLINNLIDYAKPKINNKQIVNISEIIISCSMLIKPTLQKNSIKLIISDDENLSLFADKNQIKQVLINILLNAIDSIKEKIKNSDLKNNNLHIFINAWEDSEYVYIQIIDEGLGMTDDEIKKSMRPFHTNKSNGTGIGLNISKQYVEENNGVFIIESNPQFCTKVTMKFSR